MQPSLDAAARPEPAGDESLMRDLAAGRQEALVPLYQRYAPLVFNLAAQTLDRGAAEEIVQEVFLAVWRSADTFDPRRGTFRSWVLQIAHLRVLNELRRRSRRPQIDPGADGERLAALAGDEPDPAEAAWQDFRRSAVRTAVDALPPSQRVALGLAFFEDLTHEQVAAVLRLPLGTAKTRIRSALLRLRTDLAPLLAALILVAAFVPAAFYARQQQATRQRDDRALALLTSSETQAVRLTPVAGAPGVPAIPPAAHATYRSRPGATIAVATLEDLPAPPAGKTYQLWLQAGGRWLSLGTALPDASGGTRLIVEGPLLALPPEALQVTLEPAGGSSAPGEAVVLRWTAGQ
jgi:RNA polymerase sigma-70 factor (ECF subfamily)